MNQISAVDYNDRNTEWFLVSESSRHEDLTEETVYDSPQDSEHDQDRIRICILN